MPEGVALLDWSWRVVLANSRAQQYLYELGGVNVGDIVHSLGGCPIEQLISAADNRICREITTDGFAPRVFEVGLSPVRSDSATSVEDLSEWVLVIREVTDERQIQQRIQLQDRLAVIGQFAAGIAHDFNNILASIILEPYLIRKLEPNLSPKGYERLDGIAQQAKRASGLIRQILDFSRTSSTDTHRFDMIPMLKEITRMLERILPSNIYLELIYAPDDYNLQGDPNRIMQMLMNLTLNARDAMPKGGTLYVELARVSGDELLVEGVIDDRQWLRFRVRDDGIGIHPEVLPHIFEPFFTTKAVGQGTGLGLAQVYGIVQQHEGYIHVDSRLECGTTFSVYLPALPSTAAIPIASGELESALMNGNQQTILVVEDNLIARQSICDILEFTNYHVLTAGNGREALSIIDQPESRVDLILSDLDMPEMDGLQLCREVRAQAIDVPIIIVSGYISDDTLTELQSLSVAECLVKPIDVDQLLELVESSWHMPST
jgi:signal transduction histidine kinase/CheY-like chemotaxis protein